METFLDFMNKKYGKDSARISLAMDKRPSRDAYVVLCNDRDGNIPKIINAIGRHGNGGHTFDIVLDPDSTDKETFCWDGDGSDRIDGIVKLNGKDADKDCKDALINMLLHTLDSIRWQAEGPSDCEKPDLVRELQGIDEKPMTREEMLKVFDDIIHDADLCLRGCGYENLERRSLENIKEYCKSELVAMEEGRRNSEESGEREALEHIEGIAEEALSRRNKK